MPAALRPAYGLNIQLDQETSQPPIPLAKSWAQSYPNKSSPFASSFSKNGEPLQPLLNLAQGVPGHAPNQFLVEQMDVERQREPMEAHGYGGVFGDESLRKALANDINRVYVGANVQHNEIAITAGGNLAAAVTFHALASPGEAVVVPIPWYFNHQMTLTSLGINVIALETESPHFLPNLDHFQRLLEKHNFSNSKLPIIKAITLVTPNNPCGTIYPAKLLRSFGKLCKKWKVALIVDETYRDFLLQGDRSNELETKTNENGLIPLASPHDLFNNDENDEFDWRDVLISLHSFSKSYAIPGHRLGAIISHHSMLFSEEKDEKTGKLIQRFGCFAKSLDNMQICPPRTDTQRAVAKCITLKEHQIWRLEIANDLKKRRIKFLESLEEQLSFEDVLKRLQLDLEKNQLLSIIKELIPSRPVSPSTCGWKCQSLGAYYAYVEHPKQFNKDLPSSEIVAKALASLVGIVTLPGTFFKPKSAINSSIDNNLRFSIANVESSKLETLSARLLLFTWLINAKGINFIDD